MIPAQTNTVSGEFLSSENNQSKMGVEINEEIYGLFASKVYNNKIAAVCREYICNAVDSHIEAGKADTPVDVILPNNIENVFAVRDYGIGLDEEGVRDVFSTFLKSSKKDKAEPTGFLGIGSKSAFSYTSSFTITSVKDGVKRVFVAFVGDDNVPTLDMLSSTETDQQNGVEVRVVVDQRDFKEFEKTSAFVSSFTSVPVNMSSGQGILYPNVRTSLDEKGYYVSTVTTMEDGLSGVYRGEYIGFVMGGVVYPMRKQELSSILKENNEHATANLLRVFMFGWQQKRIYIDVPLGELEFSFSRENLSMTTATTEAVVYYTTKRLNSLVERVNDDIKSCEHIVKAYRMVEGFFGKVPSGVFKWNGIDIIKAAQNFPLCDYMDVSVLRYDRGTIKKTTNFDLKNLHEDTTLVVCDTKKAGAIKWTTQMMKDSPEKWKGKCVLIQRTPHSDSRTKRILDITGMDVMYASDIIPEKTSPKRQGKSSRGSHLVRCISVDTTTGRKYKSDVVDISDKNVAYSTLLSNMGDRYILDGDICSHHRDLMSWIKNELEIDMILVMNGSNENKIKNAGIKRLTTLIYEHTKPQREQFRCSYLRTRIGMTSVRPVFTQLTELSSKFSFDMEEERCLYEKIAKGSNYEMLEVIKYVLNMHYENPVKAIEYELNKMNKFMEKVDRIIIEHYPLLNGNFSGSMNEVEYIRAVELYRLMEDT